MTNIHPFRPHRRLTAVEIIEHGDAAAYGQLLTDLATTGRCPVWLTGYAVESLDPRWEPQRALADLETRDPASLLAKRYPGPCRYDDGCMDPFTDFPGLLPRAPVARDDAIRHAIAQVRKGRVLGDLAVVRAARPADVPAVTGWHGMINSWDDTVGVSAVLRSWEERFGALLTRLDRATLHLAVAAPPRTEQECLAVAAEHIAFCIDAFETYKGQMSTDSLARYARRLLAKPTWHFWWD